MEERKVGNRECLGELPQGVPQGTPWRMLREMARGMHTWFYNNFFYCKLNVECCGSLQLCYYRTLSRIFSYIRNSFGTVFFVTRTSSCFGQAALKQLCIVLKNICGGALFYSAHPSSVLELNVSDLVESINLGVDLLCNAASNVARQYTALQLYQNVFMFHLKSLYKTSTHLQEYL